MVSVRIDPEAKTGALAAVSEAARAAAQNLLAKAINRLLAGNTGGADRLIARAVAIPFDDHELMWPGPRAADLSRGVGFSRRSRSTSAARSRD